MTPEELIERARNGEVIGGGGKQIAALIAKLDSATECIEGFVWQYGFVSNGKLSSGGMSALEDGLDFLGWGDPGEAPEGMVCDEPGCGAAVSRGWPSPAGYRKTCGKHMRMSR